MVMVITSTLLPLVPKRHPTLIAAAGKTTLSAALASKLTAMLVRTTATGTTDNVMVKVWWTTPIRTSTLVNGQTARKRAKALTSSSRQARSLLASTRRAKWFKVTGNIRMEATSWAASTTICLRVLANGTSLPVTSLEVPIDRPTWLKTQALSCPGKLLLEISLFPLKRIH